MATSTATAPDLEKPARKAPTPKRLQKKVLTLAQAADEYERTDDALLKLDKAVKKLEAEREEAAEILLAHFAKTGRPAYKDRIGWMWTASRLILDQGKVTTYLAEQLPKFQKRTESKRKLTRLTEPKAA
jgi:Asp-tRNA(Asn)/Glu-tRNA(Gln) amidotransferase A subunit family amidase